MAGGDKELPMSSQLHFTRGAQGTFDSRVSKRRNDLKIQRSYKMVDTCAAEFEARTPYFYSTFAGEYESESSDRKKIVIF